MKKYVLIKIVIIFLILILLLYSLIKYIELDEHKGHLMIQEYYINDEVYESNINEDDVKLHA
jgi:hypothetical protein